MAQDEARSPGGIAHGSTSHRDQPVDLFEWPIYRLQETVEDDSHLESQRPSCAVVRRRRWTTRIGNIVRVVLRFKHVEHVRSKGLGRLDDIWARRITLRS